MNNLRQSGLLRAEFLAKLVSKLPDSPRGRVLARALVEDGLITRYQAEQLLAGRSQGFFLGQYRILDELGQGGMGRVFKAIHQTMNRVVAIKVLAPYQGDLAYAQQLFHREMQAIARLNHPNIVAAYDAGELGDRTYLVMEFVDGPNLDALVRQQGPLPVGQACAFARQAALGLQYAFEKGMVHRDIKPGNLLLARDTSGRGRVKILDFGLARLYEPQPFEQGGGDSIRTRENTILGTPDYVAPEQARNLHAADIRSDLYSLGCTLYFMLTGEVVFPEGTIMEKLIRHTTELPVPAAKLRPELPPAVATILDRLLAKKPADRYQTPAEVAAALYPFALDLPLPFALRPQTFAVPVTLQETNPEPLAALARTVGPDHASTELARELPQRLAPQRPTPEQEFRRRVLFAMGMALAVVSAALGLMALLWGASIRP